MKLGEIREGKFFDRKTFSPVTMDELVEKYQEWAKGKRGYRTYDAVLLPPIFKHFKGRLLSEITEYDVESFRAMRSDLPTRCGGKRSISTCNHEIGMVKTLFNKAIAWGMAEKNPAAKVRPLPRPCSRTRFLAVEEAGRLLRAASPHLRSILVCALETGMRRGEILNLRRSDVDFRNGMIFIREAKNGRSRYVPISSRLRETLQRLPRRLGSDSKCAALLTANWSPRSGSGSFTSPRKATTAAPSRPIGNRP